MRTEKSKTPAVVADNSTPDEGPVVCEVLQPSSWITEGSLLKAIFRLSLPMMGAALLQGLFGLVDMLFVGMLGPVAVAAVGVSGRLLGILHMIAVGITTGCTALVAQAVGAGDRRRAQTVLGQTLLLAIVASAAFAVLGVTFAKPLLRALKAQEDVVAAGTPYLQVVTAGSLVMFLPFVFGAALRGAGDAVTPLKVIAVANLVNVGLDPILIFGLLGMPRLGVVGSAWATVIARTLAAVMLAWVFFVKGHEQFHLRLQVPRPRARVMLQVLKIAVFGSGRMLIITFSGLVLVRIVAPFGVAALAAYTIAMRLWMMATMPARGFGNGAATVVGQSLGAGRPWRAERAGWVGAGIYALIAVPLSVMLFVLAESIVAVFNADPEVVAAGGNLLRLLAVTFVFTAFAMVLGRSMSGAGDTFWPMVLTGLSMLILRIPLAHALAQAWGSATGVWVGLAVSNAVHGLLFIGAFRWGHWKLVGQSHLRAARQTG